MRAAFRFILATLLAGTTLPAIGAEPLGRLFLTPEERRLLDAGRAPGDDQQPIPGEVPGAGGAADPVVLNGIVRRRLGPDVVWINGERPDPAGRIRLRGGPDAANRVVLEDAAGGAAVRLKPGQFWEPDTGLVADCRGCARPAPEPATTKPPAEDTARVP